jgi:hypothetical protein
MTPSVALEALRRVAVGGARTRSAIVTLVVLAVAGAATLGAQATQPAGRLDPCRRPLGDVRALWKAAENDRGVPACRNKEALWP